MAFKYNPNLQMDEPKRIANPLGFQVTEYRVDNDFARAQWRRSNIRLRRWRSPRRIRRCNQAWRP